MKFFSPKKTLRMTTICELVTDSDRMIRNINTYGETIAEWRLSRYRDLVKHFGTHEETVTLRKHVLSCCHCQLALGQMSGVVIFYLDKPDDVFIRKSVRI